MISVVNINHFYLDFKSYHSHVLIGMVIVRVFAVKNHSNGI